MFLFNGCSEGETSSGPPVAAFKRRLPSADAFAVRKTQALSRSSRVGLAAALSSIEESLEQAVLHPAIASASIDPAKNFLDAKADYDASALLLLLRRMPKGGVLHTHGLASGCFSRLVDLLQANQHCFIWQGGGKDVVEGTLRCFATAAAAGGGWLPASQCDRDKLYRYVTLPPGLPSVKACWEEFGKIWDRVLPLSCCACFYFGRNGFLWSILEKQLEANVMYLEIKEVLFHTWRRYDGSEVDDDEWTELFRKTVEEFRAENSIFLGARLVLTCHKNQSEEDVRKDFRRAVRMKERMPDFVAGFDLAGPEDLLNPIEFYAGVLEEEIALALRRGIVLPLLLHAGETNVPEASQIIDAIILGCERIGHGFALARHPGLVQEVLEAGISLECCPISNQVLGYVPDLANHAILGLLRAGVPVTLSPDDPAMWHYSDVSYDFAAAAKAWNLGLLELKALARNSLAFSTLRGQEKDVALQAWEELWDAWVKSELSTSVTANGKA
ncbi:unnamed protein product [Polarella glacialis]|uniref:Adenosine deaminase domain-containing protein n=1 Tax=Polarella glacialis TaxID=89957 RepID=A0A813K6F9_POLGL|nr:unnamed protein product [Polarella glacialis]